MAKAPKDKAEFVQWLSEAADNNTLMTAKHDPSQLGSTFGSYRTVLAHDLANDLAGFVKSGDYEVTEYESIGAGSSKYYWEIFPKVSTLSVPASGVASYSPYPTSTCDRLVAVSGSVQGLHLYGEEQAEIGWKVQNGKLKFVRKL